eukprot:TRINITY_DN1896_c0_g1_i3.p1 TRINITY_DN1896_c0_g1~~TRINITY_DN1896_c0_g1_i3.p1  ORF type:complete len:124 (+),score=25.78 TRINITY_DN1896_c0_g1_i3:1-372(+)
MNQDSIRLMNNVKQLNINLNAKLESLDGAIERLRKHPKITNEDDEKFVNDALVLLKEAKRFQRGIAQQLRSLTNEEKHIYREKLTHHDEHMKNLAKDLIPFEDQVKRMELIRGNKGNKGGSSE